MRATRGDLRSIAEFFASLKPETEEQRELVGAAKQAFARVVETTLLMARQLGNPVPLLPSRSPDRLRPFCRFSK
jgi:hypothetical protein